MLQYIVIIYHVTTIFNITIILIFINHFIYKPNKLQQRPQKQTKQMTTQITLTNHFSEKDNTNIKSEEFYNNSLSDLKVLHQYDTYTVFNCSEDITVGLLSSENHDQRYSVLIDNHNGRIIAHSNYSYAGVYNVETLNNIKSMEINTHVVHLQNCLITRGYEGCIVHAYKYNGEVRFSSTKRVDCSKSFWKQRKKYIDCIKDCNVDFDKLLSDGQAVSFVVHHPELYHVTRTASTTPVLLEIPFSNDPKLLKSGGVSDKVNCNSDKCCVNDNGKCNANSNCVVNSNYNNTNHIHNTANVERSGLQSLTFINKNEADKFLQQGSYNDEDINVKVHAKYMPGEFVDIHVSTHNNSIYDRTIRLYSLGYTWRYNIVEKNPNYAHQFWSLIDDSIVSGKNFSSRDFYNKYVIVERANKNKTTHVDDKSQVDNTNIKDNDAINSANDRVVNNTVDNNLQDKSIVKPQNTVVCPLRSSKQFMGKFWNAPYKIPRKDLVYCIYISLLYAVPRPYFNEVVDVIEKYTNKMNNISKHIVTFVNGVYDIEDTEGMDSAKLDSYQKFYEKFKTKYGRIITNTVNVFIKHNGDLDKNIDKYEKTLPHLLRFVNGMVLYKMNKDFTTLSIMHNTAVNSKEKKE